MSKHKQKTSATYATYIKLIFFIIAASVSYNFQKLFTYEPPNQFKQLKLFNCLPLISEQSHESLKCDRGDFGQIKQNIYHPVLTSELPDLVSETKKNVAGYKKIPAETCLLENHQRSELEYDTSNQKNLRKQLSIVYAINILFALLVYSGKYGYSIIPFLNRCIKMRKRAGTIFKLVSATSQAFPFTIIKVFALYFVVQINGSHTLYLKENPWPKVIFHEPKDQKSFELRFPNYTCHSEQLTIAETIADCSIDQLIYRCVGCEESLSLFSPQERLILITNADQGMIYNLTLQIFWNDGTEAAPSQHTTVHIGKARKLQAVCADVNFQGYVNGTLNSNPTLYCRLGSTCRQNLYLYSSNCTGSQLDYYYYLYSVSVVSFPGYFNFLGESYYLNYRAPYNYFQVYSTYGIGTFTFQLTIQDSYNSSNYYTQNATVRIMTCQESWDVQTMTAFPILTEKSYIWSYPSGSYQIPLYSVSSAYQICKASDIVYTMSVTASSGGSTKFITFNSVGNVINWFQYTNRVAEKFTVNLTAVITNLNEGSPFTKTQSFLLVVIPPTCAQSLDVQTITFPILDDQSYIWTQTIGSYQIPLLSVSSTLQFCTSSDIVYTMSVTASSGGSTNFINFDSVTNLMNWFDQKIRVAEKFTVNLTAVITNLNEGSPFTKTQSFLLVVMPPTCEQSLDVPTITLATISDKSYIWTQPIGSYQMPLFSVSSTLSICTSSDIVYSMSVTASSGGSTKFISFDSSTLLVKWFESTNRVSETFTIILNAQISNLNALSPFIASKSFKLVVNPPKIAMNSTKSVNNQTTDQKETTKNIQQETIQYQNPNLNEEPAYPVWQKMKITNQGQVKIYFSEKFIIPSNWTNISSDIMNLKIIPQNFDRINYLNFTWKILSFTNDYFEIQLLFQDPLQISIQRKSLDKLKIKCTNNCVGFFTSEKTRLTIESPQIIEYPIPAQLSKNKAANKALTSVVSSAQTTSSSCMSFSFVVSLILNVSLAKVWAMMNALQIIGKLPMFNTYTPANVNALFGFIENISSFKIIPTDSIVNAIMGKKEIEIFQELGPMFLVLILFLVLLIFCILSYLLRNLCRPFKIIYNWTTQFLFWNQTLRYIVEGYLDLSLNSLILVSSNLNWSTWQEKFASTFAIITVFLCTFVPCFIAIYLQKNIEKFQDPEFKLKFKEIIDSLNEKNKYCSSQIFTFCYHRLILVLLIVFVDKFPYLQTIVMTITCLIVMAIMFSLGQTMQLARDQKLEYFNQIIILMVVYHMFCFTDYVDNAETRYIMGYSMCFLACFDVFANMIVLFIVTIQEIYFVWKKRNQKIRRRKYLLKKKLDVNLDRQKLKKLKNDCKRERALQVFRLLFPIQDDHLKIDINNRNLELAIIKEDIVGEDNQDSQKRLISNNSSSQLSYDYDFSQKKVFDAGLSSVWSNLVLDLEAQESQTQQEQNKLIIEPNKEKPVWKGAQKPIPIPRMIEDIREEELAKQKAEKDHLRQQIQQQEDKLINNQLLPVKESNTSNKTQSNIVKPKNILFVQFDELQKNVRILQPHYDFRQKNLKEQERREEQTKQDQFEEYILYLIEQEKFSEIERLTDNQIISAKLTQKIYIAQLLATQKQRQEAQQLQNYGFIF